MSDIKLFQLNAAGVAELPAQSARVEKSLQTLFEANLDALLGVRFLATEYSTGPVHGGRIDTLGVDENGCPVIIEYKRTVVENVINQGLFYLDWLLDHRKEFQWLVMEKLGAEVATNVDWSGPRLVCIAGDFTRYDGHAVKQINRNIELLRYRRFGDGLLMIEQVHAPKAAKPSAITAGTPDAGASDAVASAKDPYLSQQINYRIANASPYLRDLYKSVSAYLTSLGDDVQAKETKLSYRLQADQEFRLRRGLPAGQGGHLLPEDQSGHGRARERLHARRAPDRALRDRRPRTGDPDAG